MGGAIPGDIKSPSLGHIAVPMLIPKAYWGRQGKNIATADTVYDISSDHEGGRHSGDTLGSSDHEGGRHSGDTLGRM